MISRSMFCVLALSAAAIMQCTKDNPAGPGSGSPGAGYVKIMEMSYTVSGTNAMTTITTQSQCSGSTLVSVSDTTRSLYFVTAESLLVVDTLGGVKDSSTRAQRKGAGTGLAGTWSEVSSNTPFGISMEVLYVVSTATVQGWMKKTDLITSLRVALVQADSTGTAFAGMTLDTSNADRIIFTGKTSHEAVTLSVADDGALRWSSSNSAHATQEINMFSGPVTCPDTSSGPIPTWFTAFATANPPLAKLLGLGKIRFTPKIFGR